MAVNAETTLLSPEAVTEAAQLQARAFADDPLIHFLFPDEATRGRRLPWVMRFAIGLGMPFGEVHTTRPAMLGHAVWLPPGHTHIAPEQLVAAGFVEPALHMGEQALERFNGFMDQIGPIHERLVPELHWYLLVLGVDPPHQGRGVGGMLMQPILSRADADGRRCYLETEKPDNVTFYRKHGFEVVAEDDVVGGGPHVWMMVREPQ
jgi:ribosomal protein S18 acetylase RimI-like enzyme